LTAADPRNQSWHEPPLPVWWAVPILVAALLLSVVAAGHGTLPGDRALASAIQRRTPDPLMEWFVLLNRFGQALPWATLLTVCIAAALVLSRHRAEALLVLVTLPLRLLNAGLKLLFDSPRPTLDAVQITELADGYGFPSGHASSAMIFYGVLFFIAPRVIRSRTVCRIVRIATVIMIVMAGLARIAVGAHWPSDVLGGCLLSDHNLIVIIVVYRHWTRRPTDSASPHGQ